MYEHYLSQPSSLSYTKLNLFADFKVFSRSFYRFQGKKASRNADVRKSFFQYLIWIERKITKHIFTRFEGFWLPLKIVLGYIQTVI